MKNKKKKIIISITANRSDYGIQRNLLKLLKKNKYFNLKLIVSGSHLNKNFGNTKNEIISDKINILAKIKQNFTEYNTDDVISYFSKASSKFHKIYKKNKPDLIIIVGDRYEMLAAAIPCIFLNIPIAHIHGGEVTTGSFDNVIRNCISQISKLHFTCHDNYSKKVIEMGKDPKYVFNVGSLSAENISKFKIYKKKVIEKKFKIKFGKKNALVTFHPITTEKNKTKIYYNNLIQALSVFNDINFFFTYPSPDPENLEIIKILKKFIKKNKNTFLIKSFGQEYYFSMISKVDFVIGNSSSGIIEVPSYNKPTINIGSRQEGRVRSKSIIDVSYDVNDIKKSIIKVYSKDFRKKIRKNYNVFFKQNTSKNIINKLENFYK